MDLAALADLKSALRIDPEVTEDDGYLGGLLAAASSSVAAYIKDVAANFSELESVPRDVQVATVMLAAILYRSPDNDVEQNFERGYLPKPVTALLFSYRVPTVS